jgi:hypothetical protein
MAGITELTARGPAGAQLAIRHGELLHSAEGVVYNSYYDDIAADHGASWPELRRGLTSD